MKFMGSYHDQNQREVTMACFQVPYEMKADIERSIRRSRPNQSPGMDGIHNDMLKLEPTLIAELLYEV